MNRTQKWEPDTHPGHELHTEWAWPDAEAIEAAALANEPPPPPVFVRCFLAVIDGVEQPDPQAVYEAVIAENRLKEQVAEAIRQALPDRMKKQVLDSDDDPTGELVVKNKHQPKWRFGPADGKLLFTVPGADEEAVALIAAALEPFGEQVGLE